LVSDFDLLSLLGLFDYRVLHTMVQCEAVRSPILATAWLLVYFTYMYCRRNYEQKGFLYCVGRRRYLALQLQT